MAIIYSGSVITRSLVASIVVIQRMWTRRLCCLLTSPLQTMGRVYLGTLSQRWVAVSAISSSTLEAVYCPLILSFCIEQIKKFFFSFLSYIDISLTIKKLEKERTVHAPGCNQLILNSMWHRQCTPFLKPIDSKYLSCFVTVKDAISYFIIIKSPYRILSC